MPTADLPALTRLTDDVITAMLAAEQRQRRRHGWRRGLPLAAMLVALLVPAALALHGRFAGDRHEPPRRPVAPAGAADVAARWRAAGHGYALTAAQACGTGAGALVVTGLVLRVVARGADGLPVLAPAREACA